MTGNLWMTVLFLALLLTVPKICLALDPLLATDAADTIYQNTKQASMSTDISTIQSYSQRAMSASQDLQAGALAEGDQALANVAQGAYNNAKRAAMSQSYEQGQDYSARAFNYARQARELVGQARADEMQPHERNPNDDTWDPAHAVYYQGRE